MSGGVFRTVILDFHDLPVFESAIAYPLIVVAGMKTASSPMPAIIVEPPSLAPPYPNISEVVRLFGQSLTGDATNTDGIWTFRTLKSDGDWSDRMRSNTITLNEYVGGRIFYGVQTGLNEAWIDPTGQVYGKGVQRPLNAVRHGAFIINNQERATLVSEDPRVASVLRPILGGKDIKRWQTSSRGLWVIYAPWDFDITAYPVLERHLGKFRSWLEARPEVRQGRYKWWCLRRYGSEYVGEFANRKIVYPVIAQQSTFAMEDSGAFLNDKGFMLGSDDEMLLAILNSFPFWRYLQSICSPLQGTFYEMRRVSLESCPIPRDVADGDRRALEDLTRRCIDGGSVDRLLLQREIDERVAGLYGVDLDDLGRGVP